MTLVVDASVACKWFVAEGDEELADALLSGGEGLAAPDVALAELCNIFWRKVRLKQMTPAQAEDAASRAAGHFKTLVPCAALMAHAMRISAALDHPAYDCFYLALAEELAAEMVTADTRLVRAVRRSRWAKRVRPLRS
jgi:predicted nucleic acid-binding protein